MINAGAKLPYMLVFDAKIQEGHTLGQVKTRWPHCFMLMKVY